MLPDFVRAIQSRGETYALEDRHAEAVEDFSKVIALSPEFADAYRGHGRKSGLSLGQFESARRDIDGTGNSPQAPGTGASPNARPDVDRKLYAEGSVKFRNWSMRFHDREMTLPLETPLTGLCRRQMGSKRSCEAPLEPFGSWFLPRF